MESSPQDAAEALRKRRAEADRRAKNARRDRGIELAVEGMAGWCTELGVDHEVAGNIYRAAAARGMRGRHARGLQAASMYVASRGTGNPLTIHRVAAVTGEPQKALRRTILHLGGDAMPREDVAACIAAGARRLGLPDGDDWGAPLGEIRQDLGAPMRAGISLVVAAARAGRPLSINDVADAVGLNPATLRNYVRAGGILTPRAVGQ